MYHVYVKRVAVLVFFVVLITVFNPVSVEAALHLSVNPVDGGNTLRFGHVDKVMDGGKSVRLRISSDDGRQYQVFQRLQDPLVNEQQIHLGELAVSSYAVNGSNAAGTLYSQSNEPLGSADQLIFTSSPDGQGDTLTLSYTVDPARVRSSGNFIGRIAYTVRSLGGGQDQAILNVYLEASGGFKVSVEGAKYSSKVYLESSHRSRIEDGIKISFSGNARDELRVYQEVRNFPQSEDGRELDRDVIQFVVEGGQEGNLHAVPESLGHKRELLYKSKETKEDLVVHYLFNPQNSAELKAGFYRGRVVMTVESSSGVRDVPLDFEIRVEPVFDIEVVLPPQGVRFGRILPLDPPQIKEVTVKVSSNLGKPYVVMQNVATPLVDPKGDEIKEDHFSLKTEMVGNFSGRILDPDFVPVGTGERPVFYSDSHGSPAEFKVIYRLQSYPEIAAGEYGAPIVFSLGEM